MWRRLLGCEWRDQSRKPRERRQEGRSSERIIRLGCVSRVISHSKTWVRKHQLRAVLSVGCSAV